MYSEIDLHCMKKAVEEARKSKHEGVGKPPLYVGAVVYNGELIKGAHRGEINIGEHAEFTLLDKKLPDDKLCGSTVYTTLEPCIKRGESKIPCAQRLIDRKVKKVFVGMMDPNPDICGRGVRMLEASGIEVQRFPKELIDALEEMNREFRREQEKRLNTNTSGISASKCCEKARDVKINGLKLFYYRNTSKLSFNKLSDITGISIKSLKKLERIEEMDDGTINFTLSTSEQISILEEALNCQNMLEVGKGEDHHTNYLVYYHQNHKINTKVTNYNQMRLSYVTKAIVFDFGGTLTTSTNEKTTWEKLWEKAGYERKMCFDLHKDFINQKISHQEWCDETCKAFYNGGLRLDDLIEISNSVQLVQGFNDVVLKLRSYGIKLFIVSGSVKFIISQALGNLAGEFTEIQANDMIFSTHTGVIKTINGTPYDFEGKARYIKRISKDFSIHPTEILFVGNSCNDDFAHQSGARTLCVNPQFTNPHDTEKWHDVIPDMKNLEEILEFVNIPDEAKSITP